MFKAGDIVIPKCKFLSTTEDWHLISWRDGMDFYLDKPCTIVVVNEGLAYLQLIDDYTQTVDNYWFPFEALSATSVDVTLEIGTFKKVITLPSSVYQELKLGAQVKLISSYE
jgi:hypothetical protein